MVINMVRLYVTYFHNKQISDMRRLATLYRAKTKSFNLTQRKVSTQLMGKSFEYIYIPSNATNSDCTLSSSEERIALIFWRGISKNSSVV